MTTTFTRPPTAAGFSSLASSARDYLWMHFSRMGQYADRPVPVITRGEGVYIYNEGGNRILDGLAGLFVVQAGHGRGELAEAAAKQAKELAYFPVWDTRRHRPSSSQNVSLMPPRPTSTGCSSRPVAGRRSRAPGRSPSSTSSS
jgi:hypothetical protein